MRMLLFTLFALGCQCGDEGTLSEVPLQPSGSSKSFVTAPVPHAQPNPLVLVGADGFSCRHALPMMKAGQLPNLTKLTNRGVLGKVKTSKPTQSPIIWTTIATGQPPKKHGVMGFLAKGSERFKQAKHDLEEHFSEAVIEEMANELTAAEAEGRPPKEMTRIWHKVKKKQTKDMPLAQTFDRKVKALWNMAGEAGLNVASVGWWVTWPVEQINGVMVAQTNTVKTPSVDSSTPGKFGNRKGGVISDFPGQVWPAAFEPLLDRKLTLVDSTMDERVKRIFGRPHVEGLGRAYDLFWRQSLWSIRSDAIYHEIALELLRTSEKPMDLLMVYYGGTDVLAHRFFRWFRPQAFRHPARPGTVEAFGDVIPAYYRELDRMVGELVAASPENANIMVVSDHGMYAVNTNVKLRPNASKKGARLSGGHHNAPPACLVAAGPDIRRRRKTFDLNASTYEMLPLFQSIYSITPTVLTLLNLPLAEDMSGSPIKMVLRKKFLKNNPIRLTPSYTPAGWKPDVVEITADRTDDDEQRREQLRALGYIE